MKIEEALKQIEFIKNLTEKTQFKVAYSYPYFILWGILSIAGYLGSFLLPIHLWGKLWGPISGIGMIINCILGVIYVKKYTYTQLMKRVGLQCLILFIADILIFRLLIAYAVYDLLSAYWPFQFGILIVIAGIHLNRGLIYFGLWMLAISLISFLIPSTFQNLWFAITYGGGLLLTGIISMHNMKKAQIE